MENHTAKHFALQLGSLISLYLSLSFLIALVFGIITLLYPDPANGIYEIESAQDTVRLGIAMVIVFFPAYLVLTRIVNTVRRSEGNGAYLGLTKWLIYLSLLIGGLALLGDLVAVIMSFLNGELTLRFLLKAATVFVVVGAAFYYYFLDAKEYWLTHEKTSWQFGAGTFVVVLAATIFGFMHVETPTVVREQKLDTQQITDLQTIQWRLQDYYVTNKKLPETLEVLGAPTVPTAPAGRASYQYRITEDGFTLCATFAQESKTTDYMGSAPITEKGFISNPDNWQHGTGETCFKRTLNTYTETDTSLSPGQMMKQ
jgi:hypothetical protein